MAPVAQHPEGGGIVRADGTAPTAPLADADTQAAAVAALDALARLDPRAGWDALAAGLRARLAGWGTDVMALEVDGTPVPGAGSQLGWLLWARALEGDAAAAAADRLVAPDVLTPFGLRTLSADAGAFDPLAYHRGAVWPFDCWLGWGGLRRAGRGAEAERVRSGVLEALDRLGLAPELYAVDRAGTLWHRFRWPTACRRGRSGHGGRSSTTGMRSRPDAYRSSMVGIMLGWPKVGAPLRRS